MSRPEVGFPALCRKEMLVPDVSEYGSSATALDYHLGMTSRFEMPMALTTLFVKSRSGLERTSEDIKEDTKDS